MSAHARQTAMERLFEEVDVRADRAAPAKPAPGWRIISEDGDQLKLAELRPADPTAAFLSKTFENLEKPLAASSKKRPGAPKTASRTNAAPKAKSDSSGTSNQTSIKNDSAELFGLRSRETAPSRGAEDVDPAPKRFDNELARLIDAWPTLSPRVRDAILALIEATSPNPRLEERPGSSGRGNSPHPSESNQTTHPAAPDAASWRRFLGVR